MVRRSPRKRGAEVVADTASSEPSSKRQSTSATKSKLGNENHTQSEAQIAVGPGDTTASNDNASNGKRPKKSLILNAFVEMCSGHHSPGLWRHPDDESWKFNDIEHWVQLARKLEAASIHGIFIADVLGGYDVYNGNLDAAMRSGAQRPVNEPLSLVPAMAAATTTIGFGVTLSTTYEPPYHLARRLSTVDHLTKGRLGWNIVISYLDSAARNMLARSTQIDHDERYSQAEEYVSVVYKLLESSWHDDAVVLDREEGVYTDPTRVREINHKGKYFNVPGPHLCQPSPQRTPVILEAGTSRKGKDFAAANAEGIFVSAFAPEVVAKSVAEIRQLAHSTHGRSPGSIKVLALVTVVVDATEEKPQDKLASYRQHASLEGALALFGGWTGVDLAQYTDEQELREVESNAVRSTAENYARHSPSTSKWTKHAIAQHISIGGNGPVFVGTPSQIADAMETWVAEADVDGFNLAYALFPKTFDDIIELLLPELRRRGLFWDGYTVPGGTYRENFYGEKGRTGPSADHVAGRMRWKAGVSKEEFEATQKKQEQQV